MIEAFPFLAHVPEWLHAFVLRVRTRLPRVSVAHAQHFFAAVEAMPESHHLSSLYWAGRFTLCASPEDISRYEECFREYFGEQADRLSRPENSPVESLTGTFVSRDGDGVADQQQTPGMIALNANALDILRQRDFAGMSPVELQQILRLIEALRFKQPLRRVRHLVPSRVGSVHVRRTIRAAIENHGEIARLVMARAELRPRRCVLLIDVSGSMKAYAEPLLRFGYARINGMPRSTEVFSLGSRLARLTPVLRGVAPQAAMAAAARTMPDWGGGTRLGNGLQAFLDGWGQQGMARGAIVVIASDGWESGGAELLAEQMSRLRRLAHWVVWVNPHKSSEGFEPVTAGMKAALPHVDAFVGGASFDELTALGQVLDTAPLSTRGRRRSHPRGAQGMEESALSG